jgi:adenylate cyclase
VGGLPVPRPNHAQAIAAMALDMQDRISEFCTATGKDFSIRIGINTGPVIAGIIGTKKFIYDLWGDTVNIASRMESHGVPGCIQVTEATYKRLQSQFLFEERGMIQVKGKGQMNCYLLKGKKE